MTRALALSAAALLLSLPLSAAEPDKYLPDGTTSVVTINIKQVLESPLGKKYIAPLVEKAIKDNADLTLGLNALGFDPLKDFDSVTLATPDIGSSDPQKEAAKATIILHGNFDLPKVQSTAEALVKQMPDKIKMTKEGELSIYESKSSDQPGFLAFLDKNTAVASATKSNVIAAAKGGGKGPKLGKEMTALLGKVDAKQSVWIAAVAPPEMKKALKDQPQTTEIADKINAFSGGVTFTKDVAVSLAVHTADVRTAEAIVEALDAAKGFGKLALTSDEVAQQLGKDLARMVGDTVDAIKVGSTKSDATVSLKVSEDTILKVIEAVGLKK